MILVDTSVVIDYIRGKDAKLLHLIPQLPVSICGITRAEVLCGARNAAQRQNLTTLLNAYQFLTMPDPIWDSVGDHISALRSSGVTVPFQDIVVATVGFISDLKFGRVICNLAGFKVSCRHSNCIKNRLNEDTGYCRIPSISPY